MQLYLAGPDVFLREAVEIGRCKKALCWKHGFEGLFPLDNDVPEDATAIFAANRRLMDRADAGLFNLSPFRGPSADAGTVFELGFMAAQGKPVYGYSNDPTSYAARAVRSHGPSVEDDRVLRDRDGHMVERFGLAENLMIAEAIRASGGAFVAKAERADTKLAAFQAFEICIEMLNKGLG
jgi:nucleoside 2-deoxyribosyltransferase